MKMMTKSPKLATFQAADYPGYNAYQLDLAYLQRFIQAGYPRLETKVPAAVFDSVFEARIAAAGQLASEAAFDLMLSDLMTLLQDAHACYTVDYRQVDHRFFYLYLMYAEGDWYIHHLDRRLPDTLIGRKVVALNGMAVADLDARIQQHVCGETPDARRWQYMRQQRYPTFLQQIGVAYDRTCLTLTYEDGDQTRTDTLHATASGGYHPTPFPRYQPAYLYKQGDGFFYTLDRAENFGYFQMNTCLDYVAIKSDLSHYTSWFVRPVVKLYLRRQTREARDFGREIAAFFREVEAQSIDHVILDLRHNGGGDERLGKQFLWYLDQARTQPPRGFTDYVRYSEYFGEMVKKEARRTERQYRARYGVAPELGQEINMTALDGDRAFFDDITDPKSGFFLDSTVAPFTGQLYVLTSPNTNSAAQILATTIVDNGLGEVVGLPPGNTPTTQTGALRFKLPHTKRILALSYYYMERPDRSRDAERALQLDQVIYQTYPDRLRGRHSAFEYLRSRMQAE